MWAKDYAVFSYFLLKKKKRKRKWYPKLQTLSKFHCIRLIRLSCDKRKKKKRVARWFEYFLTTDKKISALLPLHLCGLTLIIISKVELWFRNFTCSWLICFVGHCLFKTGPSLSCFDFILFLYFCVLLHTAVSSDRRLILLDFIVLYLGSLHIHRMILGFSVWSGYIKKNLHTVKCAINCGLMNFIFLFLFFWFWNNPKNIKIDRT